MSVLFELRGCQTHWSCAQIIFQTGSVVHGDLNKDPMMLDEARSPLSKLLYEFDKLKI